MKCKTCDSNNYYCANCGLIPLSKGFCSWKCFFESLEKRAEKAEAENVKLKNGFNKLREVSKEYLYLSKQIRRFDTTGLPDGFMDRLHYVTDELRRILDVNAFPKTGKDFSLAMCCEKSPKQK